MPCCRRLAAGIDHFDATFVIDVRKLIHWQTIYVLLLCVEDNTCAIAFFTANRIILL